MNNVKRLKDEQREKHPGFDSYMNCMSRALFTGLSTFFLGFSGAYFTQKVLSRKTRYPVQYNILVSTIVATVLSYKTTSQLTKACQAGWMAAEDKHTALKANDF